MFKALDLIVSSPFVAAGFLFEMAYISFRAGRRIYQFWIASWAKH